MNQTGLFENLWVWQTQYVDKLGGFQIAAEKEQSNTS